jgi:predicted nuclease of predicted toxin-antitoxin system
MIRVLLDQGIGHSAGPELAIAGWDAIHVRDIGLQHASDKAILDRARAERRVVCTLDADFHALLAVSGERAPSVVRLRQEGLSGVNLARLLLRIWPDIEASLALGAVVSVTEQRIRVRHLPVRGSGQGTAVSS